MYTRKRKAKQNIRAEKTQCGHRVMTLITDVIFRPTAPTTNIL